MEVIHHQTPKHRKKKRSPKRSDGGKTNSPALDNLKRELRSHISHASYLEKMGMFFDYLELSGSLEEQTNTYMRLAKENGPEWVKQTVYDYLIRHQKERYHQGLITAGTLQNYRASLKTFFYANEEEEELEGVKINWRKLGKWLPQRTTNAKDRCPTIKEVRKLLEYEDRRIKPLVYVMCSSGIRIRAWEHLKWKHVKPIRNENGEVVAAELLVYDDEDGNDKYTTYMTPEAYNALNDWMMYRKQEGEEINDESYLIRDLWQTTNIPRGAIRSFAKNPKLLHETGIRKLLDKAWLSTGKRGHLPEGKTRHEFKVAHGFRKYFYTTCHGVINDTLLELLMGHSIGMPEHYLRELRRKLPVEYQKAVPHLTINDFEKSVLIQQNEALRAENEGKLERTQNLLAETQKKVVDLETQNKKNIEFMRAELNAHIETWDRKQADLIARLETNLKERQKGQQQLA